MTDTSGRPDVSVVVVNYKSAALTLKALDAVRAASLGLDVEEIVVDNGSGGDDVDVLLRERPSATVIPAENRGFAAGNNAGIARASGRYLLLVNPDAFAHDRAVAALVEHADAHPRAGVVAPLLYDDDGSFHNNVYRRFPNYLTLFVDFCAPLLFLIRGTPLDPHNVPSRRLDHPQPIAHAVGAALLVRAEAAAQAGPLDERFFLYLEETEWQRRIAAHGWDIEVLPTAGFTHLVHGSTSTHPLASAVYHDSIARYYPRERVAVAVIAVAGTISLGALRLAVALGLDSPRLKLTEHLDTFRQLRSLRRRRAAARRGRAVAPHHPPVR